MRYWMALLALACSTATLATPVALRDLGRFDGWRDNYLTGVGMVTGLAGSGDSSRSTATRQSLANLLARYNLNIPASAIVSHNAAMVVVTASLPPFARPGDRIDVTVSSVGDALSLSGGSLLITPLKGPDDHTYCLAQGSINVNGYKFESNDTVEQKNHPTVGLISAGCTIEATAPDQSLAPDGKFRFILNDRDYSVANSIAQRINSDIPEIKAVPRDAGLVEIQLQSTTLSDSDQINMIARIEGLLVEPTHKARIVVNERSGLIVAGADISITPVTISQGDIKLSIAQGTIVSQPLIIGNNNPAVRTVVARDTSIDVDEQDGRLVIHSGNTVGDLVDLLTKNQVTTRQTIAILQALHAAGALFAEIIVQ